MNDAERILAGRLLRLAADRFSNHGCNDMDEGLLSDISASDRVSMEKTFNEWNSGGNAEDHVPFRHIGDSSWMAYLAHRLVGKEERGDVRQ